MFIKVTSSSQSQENDNDDALEVPVHQQEMKTLKHVGWLMLCSFFGSFNHETCGSLFRNCYIFAKWTAKPKPNSCSKKDQKS